MMELHHIEANGFVRNWAVTATCPGSKVTWKHPSKSRKGWEISPLLKSLHLDRNAAKQKVEFYI